VTGDGALVVATLAGGYAAVCTRWPLAKCRPCHGSGKLPSPTGRAHRRCRRCQGHGDRLRFGARLFGGKR
jgi:hypothetical protein